MYKCQKAYLVSEHHEKDSIGQNIATSTEAAVFCEIASITQNEFFKAGQSGFKPELKIAVWSNEYHNEEIIKIENTYYSIYRTFPRIDGKTELYVEKRSGENG